MRSMKDLKRSMRGLWRFASTTQWFDSTFLGEILLTMNLALGIMLILLNVMDVYYTYLAISFGVGSEMNPVIRWLFSVVGVVPVLTVKLVGITAITAYLWINPYRKLAFVGLSCAVAVYFVVVLNNMLTFCRV